MTATAQTRPKWAAPKDADGEFDHNNALGGGWL